MPVPVLQEVPNLRSVLTERQNDNFLTSSIDGDHFRIMVILRHNVKN